MKVRASSFAFASAADLLILSASFIAWLPGVYLGSIQRPILSGILRMDSLCAPYRVTPPWVENNTNLSSTITLRIGHGAIASRVNRNGIKIIPAFAKTGLSFRSLYKIEHA